MSGQDFTALLDKFGVRDKDVAWLLGVSPHAIRSWREGRRPVNETVARFLQVLVAREITPEDVAKTLNLTGAG